MAWKTPDDLKFLKSDEYVRIEGDAATVGVSDYAQDQLNDIVFVELPTVGATFTVGQSFGVVESVKAASDLMMPVSGTIAEVNTALESQPELINSDPYGAGWIIKITISGDTDNPALLSPADYAAFCETR